MLWDFFIFIILRRKGNGRRNETDLRGVGSMKEKNKAARGNGQPGLDTYESVAMTNFNNFTISQLSNMFDKQNIKLIKLKGYGPSNKKEGDNRYSEAKTPSGKWKDVEPLTEEQAQVWVKNGGWLGLEVPEGFDVVDVDDKQEGELVRRLLSLQGLKFHEMQTKNGLQFFFKTSGNLKKQRARFVTALGIVCDYRLSGKGYTVLPTQSTEGRSWGHIESGALSETPFYLEPTPKMVNKPGDRPFSVPIQEARNNTVHSWLCALVEFNLWNKEQLQQIGELIFDSICNPSYSLTDGKETAEQTIKSALSHKPSGKNYEASSNRSTTTDIRALPNVPISEKVVLPHGWLLSEGNYALYQESSNKNRSDQLVSHNPIVITGRYENLTDHTTGIVTAFLQNGNWKEIRRGRDYMMVQNKLVELSSFGFPVTSVNARKIVQFLSDFEACNQAELPILKASEQLGWINRGFLIGKTFIDENGKECTKDETDAVSFIGADAGDEQFVQGFHTRGSLEEWLETVGKVQDYHRVMVGLYVSFASVLVELFKSNVFIYELSSDTSKGKTISMRIFASVWGNPDEKRNGILKKWNTTLVNLERLAGISNNVPLFLDDTKEADPNSIARSIYQLTSGQGKGRGSTKGTQKTKYWNNVIFSTGEQKITNFSKDGGTAGRTLTVNGLPFGEDSPETGRFVKRIDLAIRRNYGHAGREFIKFILKKENQDDWEQWEERWFEYQDVFISRVPGNNSVAGRLAEYAALIAVAAQLVNLCFGVQWDAENIILQWWDELIAENQELDRPKEALQAVYDWAIANRSYFKFTSNETIKGPCYGEWEDEIGWTEIRFNTLLLEDQLTKLGYEAKAIIKSWKNRGWLDTSHGYRKQFTRRGSSEYYVVVKREALES
ncbi:DUF927 domain-containing protein [Metabacillus fastidiosus]|uniref:DUF927 domain-containing protein n=1 Tax=Metabacillus fastidiosus TaxID=1458 RepID=UPI003D28350A